MRDDAVLEKLNSLFDKNNRSGDLSTSASTQISRLEEILVCPNFLYNCTNNRDEGHTVRVEEERNHRLGSKSRGKIGHKTREAAAIANAEKSASAAKPFLAAHMPLKHSD